MNGSWTYNDYMTVEICVDYCNNRGFAYAAPENGNECFCKNNLNPKYAPKDGIMGSCSKPCVGNANEICGNANAMSIYHKCSATSCKNNDIGGVAPAQSQAVVARSISPSAMTTVVIPAITTAI
ncbi:wsc-like protein [Alternaria alternata]|nr:wsc-like protein [Alternaria alternata]